MAERAAVGRHAKPEIINSEQGGQFTCNAFLDPLRQEEVPDLWTLGRFMRRAGTDHATIASSFSCARARCPWLAARTGRGKSFQVAK
jgi:hypothetical protein